MAPAPVTYQLLAVGGYPTQLTRLFGHCDHARYRWSSAPVPDPEQPDDWPTGAEFVELNARDPRWLGETVTCRWIQVRFDCDCAAHPENEPQW
ncbi:hypothetical protein [Hymenobacter siberiensis]|uniref:hypothetical protein n=1 Tax=Hymenobacter siberiensis TaxID=2848396 RepID=UPI001C1E05A4|nr:hypothetical protein [Hymenobacter siberiensis]